MLFPSLPVHQRSIHDVRGRVKGEVEEKVDKDMEYSHHSPRRKKGEGGGTHKEE